MSDAATHIPVSTLAAHALDDMERSFEAGNVNFGWYILRLTALADTLGR